MCVYTPSSHVQASSQYILREPGRAAAGHYVHAANQTLYVVRKEEATVASSGVIVGLESHNGNCVFPV